MSESPGKPTRVTRETVERVVRKLNEILREIGDTVERHAKGGKALRSKLRVWVRDTPLAKDLGGVVGIEGEVSVDAVLRQLDDRPLDDFVRAAHELVSFAMFVAIPSLPAVAEQALAKWVNQRMASLR